jgi:hypothetical protein
VGRSETDSNRITEGIDPFSLYQLRRADPLGRNLFIRPTIAKVIDPINNSMRAG